MRNKGMMTGRTDLEETRTEARKKQALLSYKTAFVGRKKTKESILDNPVFGSGLIVLVGAAVILPLIAAFVYIYQSATANVDVPVLSTAKWDAPELKDEQYLIYKAKFERLAQGNLTGNELDLFVTNITELKEVPVKVIETFYSIFKIYEKRLNAEQNEKVDTWRNIGRLSLGLNTPITNDQLYSMIWKPDDMQYDIPTVESNSFKVSLYGVLFGIIPGLILGLALARGRIPFINRIFDAFWEYWFAIPSIAILFIGTWVFKDSYLSSKSAYGFVSLLMGLMIAPHIAFYIQQGFENIRKKSILTECLLSVLIVLSAVAIGVARLVGEAVLTLGLLSTV
ncbi:MAG: ABC transporter permease, partial [Candidatus Heimdallarchaeota archaeon]|nr:ABC transporter permease [Candidatus Heimdallarchaeota archaeon]